MVKNTKYKIQNTILVLFLLIGALTAQAQQEVLTRQGGGAEWDDVSTLSTLKTALNFTPSTGNFTYTTDDEDYTVVNENTSGTTREIELHSSSSQGKVLILVNRTSSAVSFSGSISGYNGINGSTITSLSANSSVKIQWDNGDPNASPSIPAAWYEVLAN